MCGSVKCGNILCVSYVLEQGTFTTQMVFVRRIFEKKPDVRNTGIRAHNFKGPEFAGHAVHSSEFASHLSVAPRTLFVVQLQEITG